MSEKIFNVAWIDSPYHFGDVSMESVTAGEVDSDIKEAAEMGCQGCGSHAHPTHNGVYIRAQCHPDTPLHVAFTQGNLILSCAACNTIAIVLKIERHEEVLEPRGTTVS